MKNNLLYLIAKSARPRQWIKNIALYAALIFSGFFFYQPANELPYFYTVTFAVIVFCVLTSSIYIINDIIDRDADRLHPFKKKRPIASGALPIPIAITVASGGLVLVFLMSLFLSPFFQLTVASYFLLQILY